MTLWGGGQTNRTQRLAGVEKEGLTAEGCTYHPSSEDHKVHHSDDYPQSSSYRRKPVSSKSRNINSFSGLTALRLSRSGPAYAGMMKWRSPRNARGSPSGHAKAMNSEPSFTFSGMMRRRAWRTVGKRPDFLLREKHLERDHQQTEGKNSFQSRRWEVHCDLGSKRRAQQKPDA